MTEPLGFWTWNERGVPERHESEQRARAEAEAQAKRSGHRIRLLFEVDTVTIEPAAKWAKGGAK